MPLIIHNVQLTFTLVETDRLPITLVQLMLMMLVLLPTDR